LEFEGDGEGMEEIPRKSQNLEEIGMTDLVLAFWGGRGRKESHESHE
jgi:hypothetical protein